MSGQEDGYLLVPAAWEKRPKSNVCHDKIHRTFGKDLLYGPILIGNRINAGIHTYSVHRLRTWLCGRYLRELLIETPVVDVGHSRERNKLKTQSDSLITEEPSRKKGNGMPEGR